MSQPWLKYGELNSAFDFAMCGPRADAIFRNADRCHDKASVLSWDETIRGRDQRRQDVAGKLAGQEP